MVEEKEIFNLVSNGKQSSISESNVRKIKGQMSEKSKAVILELHHERPVKTTWNRDIWCLIKRLFILFVFSSVYDVETNATL